MVSVLSMRFYEQKYKRVIKIDENDKVSVLSMRFCVRVKSSCERSRGEEFPFSL